MPTKYASSGCAQTEKKGSRTSPSAYVKRMVEFFSLGRMTDEKLFIDKLIPDGI
jgi:hypothetical protein